jgi:hypothetical protein
MPPRRLSYLFYVLHAAALLAVLVPFLRSNNLLEWDFPGHYAAVWYLKNFLLPWPSGWNPFFYCGFPQGLFYPPLAHYAAALLAYGVGIGPAMKLLVTASLLALPAVFYALARRAELDELQSGIAATWMTALLFLSGELFGTWTFGADLKSILNVGLFANALSLPVLFLFFTHFGREGGPRAWKVPALLWGILVLLHPLSSLVAGIYAAAVVGERAARGALDRAGLTALARILGVGTLIGACWALPFVLSRSAMNAEFTGPQWSSGLILVLFNGLLLAVGALRKPALRPLAVFYTVLGNFIIVGSLARADLQFTRLTIFLFFPIPIFVLAWLRSRALLAGLGVAALAVGFYGYRHSGLDPEGVPGFDLPNFGPVAGRILSVSPPSHLPSYHVNHDLIPLRTGNLGLMGLFIESSLNGRFLGNLMRTIDPESHVWGTPTESLTPAGLGADYPQYVRERLRLFDIRHIYTDLRLEDVLGPPLIREKRAINRFKLPRPPSGRELEALKRRYHSDGESVEFYLYTLVDGAPAEPLAYLPTAAGTEWKQTALKWFFEVRGVPVFVDRPLPAGVRPAGPGDAVAVVENGPDRVRLDIRSQADIPVLIKNGYSPNWRLTVGGREAPLYRAAPNLMLVVGHGEAVLEYRRSAAEYAGFALSLLGLVLLVLL